MRVSVRTSSSRAVCPVLAAMPLLVIGLLIAQPAAARQASSDAPRAARPVIQASPAVASPHLDGDILNDPAWQHAVPATGFWQTTPDEGQPASQQTEVRIIYTADTLYVGAVCYDSHPTRIIVSDSRRDASLNETDSFQFILDTYNDKLNGYLFGTNPAGIEYDAHVTNEGQGGGFNLNWDGSWVVRTQISEIGWSAEFAIPFRTLRFAGLAEQRWGVNFQRNIRRRNETAFWSRLQRQYGITRLADAGTLAGLEIRAPKNLKVTPYTLAEVQKGYRPATDTDFDPEFGLDAKYSITSSLTLDATYNTDFAQVEADEFQINLDRFNLFFPEKRPFFLENAGLFTVSSSSDVELFFSRRIGLDGSGRRVPILGGGRLYGKSGRSNIGVLNLQTESVLRDDISGVSTIGDTVQANNFFAARFSQELGKRSSVGFLLVNRQGTGRYAAESDYNRTVAIDGRWGINRHATTAGFFARTFTPGETRPQHAFDAGITYELEAWELEATYGEVAPGFNPEVGFLRRRAFRKVNLLVFNSTRMNNWLGLHEVRPHVSYRGYWGYDDGLYETGFLHIDNHWEWKNGYEFHTGVNITREGVRNAFSLSGLMVPAGTYDHAEVSLVGITNRGAPVSLEQRLTVGGFFGGRRVSAGTTLMLRRGEALTTNVSYTLNKLDLPAGETTINLVRLRVSYSFTPRIFIQGLIQYNDSADLFATNLRFGWLQAASTGLYLVYNEVQDVFDDRFAIRDRSFIVKYTRLFDLLN